MDQNVAKASAVTVLAAGLGVGALAVLHNSQQLDHRARSSSRRATRNTTSWPSRYQEDLRKYGVQVEVRRTARFKDKEGRTR